MLVVAKIHIPVRFLFEKSLK